MILARLLRVASTAAVGHQRGASILVHVVLESPVFVGHAMAGGTHGETTTAAGHAITFARCMISEGSISRATASAIK